MVATTPAMNALPVSWIQVELELPLLTMEKLGSFLVYYWLVSTTPVRHDVTGIDSTGIALISVKCVRYQTYLIPDLFVTELI